MSTPATPTAAPAPSAPVNATMQAATTPATIANTSLTPGERAAKAMAAARAMPADGSAPAAPVATPAPAATEQKPADAKPDDAAAKPEPAKTVTARIADLTRRNRELEAKAASESRARQEAEARASQVDAALTEAKKGGTQLEAIRAAFKADPLAAFEQLGEKWSDIVARVASGGRPPTPEEQAAAEAERKENEREARLKRIEEETKAEKAAREARETAEKAAREAETAEGAVKYVVNQLISAEKHPFLVNLGADAAHEALAQVDAALAEAFKKGLRKSPHPESMDESVRITKLALDGLNEYYSELSKRLTPPKAPEQTGATAVAGTAASAQSNAQPASAVSPESAQQRRPINTMTNAVAGESPPAAQPERRTAEDARNRAIEAARRLPPLVTA